MAKEPLTIKVDPASELARALAAADAPVLLDTGGTRYSVTKASSDPLSTYDPARIRAGLKRFAGLISPEEGEHMKALVYRGRDEGTRPITRP